MLGFLKKLPGKVMRYWFGVPRAICVYVGVIVTIGTIFIVQNVWDLGKSDWAAWVQAIGSILAIVGAWLGIRYQLERVTKQRRDAIIAIAGAANARADQVRGYLLGADPHFELSTKFHQSIIDGLVHALNGASVDEIGSPEGVSAFLEMQYQVVLLGTAIQAFIKGPYGDPEFVESAERLRKQGYSAEVIENIEESRRQVLRKILEDRTRFINERYTTLSSAVTRKATRL